MPMCGTRTNKYELSEQMSETWINFARKGDPNNPWLPQWDPYTPEHRATMLFDVPSHQEIDPGREELDAWKGMPLIR
jgi:para-nitrobenzyl esterase